jgi:hypothetical protein
MHALKRPNAIIICGRNCLICRLISVERKYGVDKVLSAAPFIAAEQISVTSASLKTSYALGYTSLVRKIG